MDLGCVNCGSRHWPSRVHFSWVGWESLHWLGDGHSRWVGGAVVADSDDCGPTVWDFWLDHS